VQKLSSFTARTGRECVVIFDHGLPGGSSRMGTRKVQVVFASGRSTADRVMIERINKIPDPRDWVVVSSDREVMSCARRRRMGVLHAEEFIDLLQSPPKPVVDEGERSDVSLSDDEVDEWLDLFGGSLE
jgi:hypothetical protein